MLQRNRWACNERGNVVGFVTCEVETYAWGYAADVNRVTGFALDVVIPVFAAWSNGHTFTNQAPKNTDPG